MKYLLTLFGRRVRWGEGTPEQQAESMKAWDDFTQAVIDAGVLPGRRGPPAERHRHHGRDRRESGDPIVSDGPFAETKEQLGGYYLLDCKDLDDALAWAKRIPMPGGTSRCGRSWTTRPRGSEAHSNAAEAAR